MGAHVSRLVGEGRAVGSDRAGQILAGTERLPEVAIGHREPRGKLALSDQEQVTAARLQDLAQRFGGAGARGRQPSGSPLIVAGHPPSS
ncbi:MAG TPA: hypothetical protein VEL76_12715 [Gemmataceae bacterium]|nr:hypothetical protein [Gemmataceae bacterium]